jgi:hypothetical protein
LFDPELTQASKINQSSVLRLNIPNRLIKRATTKIVAWTKVAVVTIKTALPREWSPPMEDIGLFFNLEPSFDLIE